MRAVHHRLIGNDVALRTSNVTFPFLINGAFLGSSDTIVDPVGSRVDLAPIAASAVVTSPLSEVLRCRSDA